MFRNEPPIATNVTLNYDLRNLTVHKLCSFFIFSVVFQTWSDSCLQMVASALPPGLLPSFCDSLGNVLFGWLLRCFSVNTATPVNP